MIVLLIQLNQKVIAQMARLIAKKLYSKMVVKLILKENVFIKILIMTKRMEFVVLMIKQKKTFVN